MPAISKTLANIETSSAALTATWRKPRHYWLMTRTQRFGAAVANIEGAAGEARVFLRDAGKLIPHMISLTEK